MLEHYNLFIDIHINNSYLYLILQCGHAFVEINLIKFLEKNVLTNCVCNNFTEDNI